MIASELIEAVERWRHVAIRLCARFPSDWDADDLIQETLLRAWRYRDSYRGESLLTTWTHQIMVNTYQGHCKSKRIKLMRLSDADSLSVDMPAMDNVAGSVADRQLLAAIHAAMIALPDTHRSVMQEFIGGSDYLSVAESHGIPIGTVRSRINRARAMLVERIDS